MPRIGCRFQSWLRPTPALPASPAGFPIQRVPGAAPGPKAATTSAGSAACRGDRDSGGAEGSTSRVDQASSIGPGAAPGTLWVGNPAGEAAGGGRGLDGAASAVARSEAATRGDSVERGTRSGGAPRSRRGRVQEGSYGYGGDESGRTDNRSAQAGEM